MQNRPDFVTIKKLAELMTPYTSSYFNSFIEKLILKEFGIVHTTTN